MFSNTVSFNNKSKNIKFFNGLYIFTFGVSMQLSLVINDDVMVSLDNEQKHGTSNSANVSCSGSVYACYTSIYKC